MLINHLAAKRISASFPIPRTGARRGTAFPRFETSDLARAESASALPGSALSLSARWRRLRPFPGTHIAESLPRNSEWNESHDPRAAARGQARRSMRDPDRPRRNVPPPGQPPGLPAADGQAAREARRALRAPAATYRWDEECARRGYSGIGCGIRSSPRRKRRAAAQPKVRVAAPGARRWQR